MGAFAPCTPYEGSTLDLLGTRTVPIPLASLEMRPYLRPCIDIFNFFFRLLSCWFQKQLDVNKGGR